MSGEDVHLHPPPQKKKKVLVGNKSSNLPPKSSHTRKKTPLAPFSNNPHPHLPSLLLPHRVPQLSDHLVSDSTTTLTTVTLTPLSTSQPWARPHPHPSPDPMGLIEKSLPDIGWWRHGDHTADDYLPNLTFHALFSFWLQTFLLLLPLRLLLLLLPPPPPLLGLDPCVLT